MVLMELRNVDPLGSIVCNSILAINVYVLGSSSLPITLLLMRAAQLWSFVPCRVDTVTRIPAERIEMYIGRPNSVVVGVPL